MKAKHALKMFSGAALALVLGACNVSFTTSHISSLILSKDAEGVKETSSFGPHDTVFAKAVISNVSGKVTLKWHFIVEKAPGQPDNTVVADLDKTFELASDGNSTYNLSPPDSGFPAGKYRLELHMLVEGGEEKDQKSAPFSITAD